MCKKSTVENPIQLETDRVVYKDGTVEEPIQLEDPDSESKPADPTEELIDPRKDTEKEWDEI